MKKYVVGFLFSESGQFVALVEKLRPEWQKGRLNGIGGKVEPGETPLAAMVREFEEEAGVKITCWRKFCVLTGDDTSYNDKDKADQFEVHFFSAFSDDVRQVKTIEAEAIKVIPSANLPMYSTVPHLRWLIPMALERVLTAKVAEGSRESQEAEVQVNKELLDENKDETLCAKLRNALSPHYGLPSVVLSLRENPGIMDTAEGMAKQALASNVRIDAILKSMEQ